MRSAYSILVVAGALALSGCGKHGPVADDAVAPPANVVGDAAADGLAAPANAAAAAAHDGAAAPAASDGMAWLADADGRGAAYGAARGVKLLSLGCQPGKGQLIVTRHAGAPTDGTATMSLTGSGHASSLPVVAARAAEGTLEWRAVAGGDMGRAFARAFAVDGPVQLTIGGAPDLVVPANARVRGIIARCLG